MLPQTSSHLALPLCSPGFNSHAKKQYFLCSLLQNLFSRTTRSSSSLFLEQPSWPRFPGGWLSADGFRHPHQHRDLTLRSWKPLADLLLASPTESNRPHRLSCPLPDEEWSLQDKAEAPSGNAGGMQRMESRDRQRGRLHCRLSTLGCSLGK